MSPFKIALTLGQRVHTTRGRTLRGRWGLVPNLPKRGLVVPKVFTAKRQYLRYPREMDFRHLYGSNQEP